MDGFAITALICGIVGCFLLSRIRKSGRRGRRLAVTGLVLLGVWLVAVVVALPDSPHPGGDRVPDSIYDACSSRPSAYAPNAHPADVGVTIVHPSSADRSGGFRTVDCLGVAADGDPTTGSLKNG